MDPTSTPTPQGAAAGASLGEDVAVFLEAAERIGARVAAGEHLELDGVSQVGLVSDLVRADGLGEAVAAVLSRAVHVSGDLRTSGFFSVKGFLADEVRVSVGAANRISKLGTALERYPLLRTVVLAGRVHPDAARAAAEGIASAVADLRGSAREDARARGEAIMAPVCETGTVTDVEKVAASLIFHLDPESAARRALEALEKREVRVGRVGAAAVVHMVLDAMTAAQLIVLLEARVDSWFRTGSLPEDLQPSGDDAEDERRLTLARPRLLAEAFAEILAELLTTGPAGSQHGAPVNVSMLVSEDIHQAGGPGELLIPGREPVPVPAETVERVLCDAQVTEVHVHGTVAERSSLGQIARSDRHVREAAAGVHPGDLARHDTGNDNPGDPRDLTGQCGHVHCVGRRAPVPHRDPCPARRAHGPGPALPVPRLPDRRVPLPGPPRPGVGTRRRHLLVQPGAALLEAPPPPPRRAMATLRRPAPGPRAPDRWRFLPPETGYVGRDGALLAERLRRGLPPEPPGSPPPHHAAA